MRPLTVLELNAVVAIGRHRSFRTAAVELGISRTALSHAIATLEARLGIWLFHRTTRSVSLTAAGEQFVTSVGPALADIGSALDAVNSHRPCVGLTSFTARRSCQREGARMRMSSMKRI